MFEVGTIVCKKRGKYKGIPGIIVHRHCSIYNNKPCLELTVNLLETGTILTGRHYGFKIYNTRPIADCTDAMLNDAHTILESGLDLANRWEKEEVSTKLIGGFKFMNAHIEKHHWSDRLGGHGINYRLKLTKDDFESLLEDGLPAKHNEKTGEYFINITPISKEGPCSSIPEESTFVDRDDINCAFDLYEFTVAGKTFQKVYLRAEGIETCVKENKDVRS